MPPLGPLPDTRGSSPDRIKHTENREGETSRGDYSLDVDFDGTEAELACIDGGLEGGHNHRIKF